MKVISWFDYSGEFVKPWAEAGFECYCLDIQHSPGVNQVSDNIYTVGDRAEWWLPPLEDVAFQAFFPPCDDDAVSGARWFKSKGLFRLADSIRNFAV